MQLTRVRGPTPSVGVEFTRRALHALAGIALPVLVTSCFPTGTGSSGPPRRAVQSPDETTVDVAVSVTAPQDSLLLVEGLGSTGSASRAADARAGCTILEVRACSEQGRRVSMCEPRACDAEAVDAEFQRMSDEENDVVLEFTYRERASEDGVVGCHDSRRCWLYSDDTLRCTSLASSIDGRSEHDPGSDPASSRVVVIEGLANHLSDWISELPYEQTCCGGPTYDESCFGTVVVQARERHFIGHVTPMPSRRSTTMCATPWIDTLVRAAEVCWPHVALPPSGATWR